MYYKNTLYYSYLDYDYYSSITSGNYSQVSQVTMAKSEDNGSTWTTTRASQNTGFPDKETFIISPQGTIYLTYDAVNQTVGLVKLSKSK